MPHTSDRLHISSVYVRKMATSLKRIYLFVFILIIQSHHFNGNSIFAPKIPNAYGLSLGPRIQCFVVRLHFSCIIQCKKKVAIFIKPLNDFGCNQLVQSYGICRFDRIIYPLQRFDGFFHLWYEVTQFSQAPPWISRSCKISSATKFHEILNKFTILKVHQPQDRCKVLALKCEQTELDLRSKPPSNWKCHPWDILENVWWCHGTSGNCQAGGPVVRMLVRLFWLNHIIRTSSRESKIPNISYDVLIAQRTKPHRT